jgi:integrase
MGCGLGARSRVGCRLVGLDAQAHTRIDPQCPRRRRAGGADSPQSRSGGTAAIVRPVERQVLTVEDARSLIESIRGDRLEAVVCALTVGLRRAELLGLRWLDIDFDAATLTVRQTVLRVDDQLVFSEPKTDRSRRRVPVPPVTLAQLRSHHPQQAGIDLRRPAMARSRPGLRVQRGHSTRTAQRRSGLESGEGQGRARLASATRSSPRLRHLPTAVGGLSPDSDEDARS